MNFEEYYRSVKQRILDTLSSLKNPNATKLIAKFYYGSLKGAAKLSREKQLEKVLKYMEPDKDKIIKFGDTVTKIGTITKTTELVKGKKYKIHFHVFAEGAEEIEFEARKVSNITVWIPVKTEVLWIQ